MCMCVHSHRLTTSIRTREHSTRSDGLTISFRTREHSTRSGGPFLSRGAPHPEAVSPSFPHSGSPSLQHSLSLCPRLPLSSARAPLFFLPPPSSTELPACLTSSTLLQKGFQGEYEVSHAKPRHLCQSVGLEVETEMGP